MRIPLGVTIAAPLLAITLCAGYFALEHAALLMEQAVEGNALRNMARQMTRLQGTLERVRHIGSGESQAEVSAPGSDENVSLILFVDDKDTVLAATRFDTIGRSIHQLPSGILPERPSALSSRFDGIRAGMTGTVALSEDRQTVTGIFPVSLGAVPGELRPSRVGILYGTYDLKRLKAAAHRTAGQQAVTSAFILVATALLAWIAFKITITRRIARIVAATRAFAAGDPDARTGVAGPDEIGSLARAFDDMMTKIRGLLNSLIAEVDERVRAEDELKRHRDYLEETVDRRTEELRRQRNILSAINRIFRETIACGTDAEVESVFLDVARELTASRLGFVGELNAGGTLDVLMLNRGAWEICDVPIEKAVELLRNMELHGYWGQVIGTGRGQIVNDPDTNPHRRGVPEGHVPILRFLGVPLRDGEKIFGLIALANKDSDYTEHDREAIEALAPAFVEALGRKRTEMERTRLILELRDALDKVRALRGLLPICSSCKKIRDDTGYWQQLEVYFSEHTDTEFTHGLCPECAEKMAKEFEKVAKMKNDVL